MSRNIILKDGGIGTSQSDLTVPSENRDVRVVAQTERRAATKRKFSTKANKESKVNARPVRKIKLNRSIFNENFQEKLSFHVKTLGEIKHGKQTGQETLAMPTEPNVNTAINSCNTSKPSTSLEGADVLDLNNAVDTRKVLKLNTRKVRKLNTSAKILMLPTIQLTRLNSGKYNRSITKRSSSAIKPRKIMSEARLKRFKAQQVIKANESESLEANKPLQHVSPSKKCRISPIRSPESDHGTPDCPATVPTSTEVNLQRPLSPALSLGTISDPELDGCAEPVLSESDAQLVINAAEEGQRSPLFNKQSPQVRLAPMDQIPSLDSALVDDDKLDVMSIMADDDELFVDECQRPALKRSLSQDSVFNNLADQDARGDLRSLLVKTKDGGSDQQKSVGDLIRDRPVSNSYKIPHVSQSEEKTPVENVKNISVNGRNNFQQQQSGSNTFGRNVFSLDDVGVQGYRRPRNRGHAFSHSHHQQKSAIGSQGETKGLNPHREASLYTEIKVNLKRGMVIAAWTLIKKLDEARCAVDVRILEEMLIVCERVSWKASNGHILGNAALGALEMIQRLHGNCMPNDFVMAIFTLCRCCRIEDGFKQYLAMKTAGKLPQDEALECFVNECCKFLLPVFLVDFIPDVMTFSLHPRIKISVVNNCVACLIGSSQCKLQQVDPEKWNSMLVILCTPPFYVQSALQVHNIMENIGVTLSPTAIYPLFKLTEESKVTQTMLKLICTEVTRKVLVEHVPPVDVAQVLLSPTVQAREVEECISNLFNRGIMPEEDILHHFVAKALLAKEYYVMHQVFLKSTKLRLTLPPPVLKAMMQALENWDENKNASVEVYAALRLAKKAPKQPVTSKIEKREVPARNSERFETGGPPLRRSPCHYFERHGYCNYGDSCRYLHNKKKDGKFSEQRLNVEPDKNLGVCEPPRNGLSRRQHYPNKQWDDHMRFGNYRKDDKSISSHSQSNDPQFVGNRSVNRQQERTGGIPSSDLVCKPEQKPNHGSGDAMNNSGIGVVNKMMVNGLSQNPSPFQVLTHRPNNPQLFRKFHGDRPPFKPQFQKNMPRFHMSEKNHAPKWNHFQPNGPGKPLPHESGKQCPGIRVSRHSSDQRSPLPVAEKPKVNRSFSWEPRSNLEPNLSNGWKADQMNQAIPGGDKNNNNGNGLGEFQHRAEMAIKCKDWKTVYTYYVKCKGMSVKGKDLLVFRSGFVKSPVGLGQNFSAFIEFLYKENCTGGSCHSSQSVLDVFDQYDIDFIGALGVSLMEKCLVSKQFDEGYEILLCLHSHNISYFQSGKNFGAYTKDIPAQNVALIAVKLCMGIGQQGGLGAMEVLRACHYALPNEGEFITPQDKDYRIKVLHQLYVNLFEESYVLECFEVLQNLDAGANVVDPMFIQLLNHFVFADDFEQAFAVLGKMHEKCMDLNIRPCHLLHEKFLKHSIATHEYDEAANSLKVMESKGILMDGGMLRNVLSMLSSAEQDTLANLLFEKCIDLKIFPQTFREGELWVCELGCGYSQQELKLLICRHLKHLRQYLVSKRTNDQLITAVKDLQIVLLPRLPGFDNGLTITDGVTEPLKNSSQILSIVLQQDLNPPLAILEKIEEQFCQKIFVEKMSVYRWFNANTSSQELIDDQESYDTLSEGSGASDCSAD